jgi:ribosomal protein S18 acetylase RimI-like enzyme
MIPAIEFILNKASEVELARHLWACDAEFIPPLSSRAEINKYARKIVHKAKRFEAWSGSTLVGLVAAYCNDQDQLIAYITNVSVLKDWAGRGIATHLISQCIEHMKALGFKQVCLQVSTDNTSAIKLYENNCFVASEANVRFVTMKLHLESWEEHEPKA